MGKKKKRRNNKSKPQENSSAKALPHYIFILPIVIIGFLVYYKSLFGSFVFDDKALIVDNPFIKNFGYLKDIFTTHLFKGSGVYSNFYRPIQSLSLMIDYHFWGMNPLGYHLTNVFLHIFNSLLVYSLVSTLTNKKEIGFTAGIIFSVHTVLSGPVNYIPARDNLLGTFFFLVSFVLYIRYFNAKNRFGVLFLLGAFFSFLVSLLSREANFMVPILFLFYLYCFSGNKRNTEKRKPTLIWLFFIVLGIYSCLRFTLLDFTEGKLLETTTGMIPLHLRLFTTSKVLMIYLRLLLLPIGLHMEWNIAPAMSFVQDEVFLSLVGVAIIAIFAFYLFRASRLKFFFFGWFFILLFPYSNVFPLNYFMGEGWLYTPSIGLFALAAVYLYELSLKSKIWRCAVIFLVSSMVLFYGFLTFRRADVWADPIKLYTEVLRYSPNNTKARINLGVILAQAGDYDTALAKYKEAAELLPDDAGVHASLGSVYAGKKMYDVAFEEFKQAIELNPKDYVVYNNLGILYKQKGNIRKAMEHYSKALEINPSYPLTYNNIANIYLETNQYDAAIRFYKKAITIDPNKAAFYANLGKAYKGKGMMNKAEEAFSQAVRLDPNHEEAAAMLRGLR